MPCIGIVKTPHLAGSRPIVFDSLLRLCTQFGESRLAYDWIKYSGFSSFASSTLNRPMLKPATVCGASLFHTDTSCPPSVVSLVRTPVTAICIPLGMRNVMS